VFSKVVPLARSGGACACSRPRRRTCCRAALSSCSTRSASSSAISFRAQHWVVVIGAQCRIVLWRSRSVRIVLPEVLPSYYSRDSSVRAALWRTRIVCLTSAPCRIRRPGPAPGSGIAAESHCAVASSIISAVFRSFADSRVPLPFISSFLGRGGEQRGRRFEAAGPGQECVRALSCSRSPCRALSQEALFQASVPHALSLSRHSMSTARVLRAAS
jgi:hypothetical protein